MTDLVNDAEVSSAARVSHLAAIAGPVIPLLVWLAHRRRDDPSSSEAAKATNWGMAVLVAAVLATTVRLYVPLLGFLGTLAQLVVLTVAVFFSVQAYRSVGGATPATYPFYIKVVKTND